MHRETGADGQGWCNLQLALYDLQAGLMDRILCAVADGADQAVVVVGGRIGKFKCSATASA